MNPYRRMRRFLAKAMSRLAASGRGAAAVEFALMATVIAAMLTGIANYGMAQFDKMELESAARAGAQMALKDRTDTTAIENAAINATNLTLNANDTIELTPSCWCADVDASATCGVTCTNGDPTQYFMTVTVKETFTLLILGTTINLSESAKVRTQ